MDSFVGVGKSRKLPSLLCTEFQRWDLRLCPTFVSLQNASDTDALPAVFPVYIAQLGSTQSKTKDSDYSYSLHCCCCKHDIVLPGKRLSAVCGMWHCCCSALLCSALLCSDADADADAVVKVLMFYVPQTVAADINDQCHGPYNLCLCLTVDKNKRI